MFIQREVVNITTDASGNATAYTNVVTGRILGIRYVADGSSPFDNTVDFTITAEATGESILAKSNVSASFTAYPRVKVQDAAGADLSYDGTHNIYEPVAVANDRVKIVLAQGGNAKVGAVHILIG